MNDNKSIEEHLADRRQEAVEQAQRNAVLVTVRVNKKDWLDRVVSFAMVLDDFIDRVRERRYMREVERASKYHTDPSLHLAPKWMFKDKN